MGTQERICQLRPLVYPQKAAYQAMGHGFFELRLKGVVVERIEREEGAWIAARPMELVLDLQSNIMLVPRQFTLTAMQPDMKAGMAWSAKYGFLGINTFGLDVATDGMNEVGLTAHALYNPGFFEYQPYTADGKNAIANTDVVN